MDGGHGQIFQSFSGANEFLPPPMVPGLGRMHSQPAIDGASYQPNQAAKQQRKLRREQYAKSLVAGVPADGLRESQGSMDYNALSSTQSLELSKSTRPAKSVEPKVASKSAKSVESKGASWPAKSVESKGATWPAKSVESKGASGPAKSVESKGASGPAKSVEPKAPVVDEETKARLFREAQKDTRYRTADVGQNTSQGFEDFGLKREILMGLYSIGYQKPSPIQCKVLPLILAGESVLARAKNGTGKTAAYSIPLLNMIDPDIKTLQAIVLTPTRELALQTTNFVRTIARYVGVKIFLSTGGTSLRDDILKTSTCLQVLIGTPVRLFYLITKKVVDVSNLKLIVLDEADKLLDEVWSKYTCGIVEFPGHQNQLQTVCVSATYPSSSSALCKKILGSFKVVNLMETVLLEGITQYYAYLTEPQKLACIYSLFSSLKFNQMIIFCNSVLRVEILQRKLVEKGVSALYIHSKMLQRHRNRVQSDFRNGASRVLVTSDLCARGIDISSVNVVVNFDFARNTETYVHRIGRSGRFGHLSVAISFITDDDRDALLDTERQLDTQVFPLPDVIPESQYFDYRIDQVSG